MNYRLLREVIHLVEKFDFENIHSEYDSDIEGFKNWITNRNQTVQSSRKNIDWEGKSNGRSAESVISTLLVHLNRYAKNYSKSAIAGSEFSTQDEFIYLINLKAFGAMTKTELIRKNIHDKPVGNLIINRLLKHNWIKQNDSHTDRRKKWVEITAHGENVLDEQMGKIRNATKIVSGNLNEGEKTELIRLLTKLDEFHNPIFGRNIDSLDLLDTVLEEYSTK